MGPRWADRDCIPANASLQTFTQGNFPEWVVLAAQSSVRAHRQARPYTTASAYRRRRPRETSRSSTSSTIAPMNAVKMVPARPPNGELTPS